MSMATRSRPGYTFTFVAETEFPAPTIRKDVVGGPASRDAEASKILADAESAEVQVFPVRDFGQLTSGCACACGYTSCAGGGTGRRLE
jgi:hypothetical protein